MRHTDPGEVTYDKDAATRLRAIVNMLGVSAPSDDETMMGSLFSVFGNVRHAIQIERSTRAELLEMLKLLTKKGVKQETGLGWNKRVAMARTLIEIVERIDIDRAAAKGNGHA